MLQSQDVSPSRPTGFWLGPDDWRLIVTARANVLLEGTPEATDAIVAEATRSLANPHASWTGAPPTGGRPATLLVRSVSELDRDQQESLLGWLETPGDRVHVISTTTRPLYPLVSRGRFLPNLYYRLNVLRLEIASAGRDDR